MALNKIVKSVVAKVSPKKEVNPYKAKSQANALRLKKESN